MRATMVDRRPRVCPSASTTTHFLCASFGLQTYVVTSGHLSLKQSKGQIEPMPLLAGASFSQPGVGAVKPRGEASGGARRSGLPRRNGGSVAGIGGAGVNLVSVTSLSTTGLFLGMLLCAEIGRRIGVTRLRRAPEALPA